MNCDQIKQALVDFIVYVITPKNNLLFRDNPINTDTSNALLIKKVYHHTAYTYIKCNSFLLANSRQVNFQAAKWFVPGIWMIKIPINAWNTSEILQSSLGLMNCLKQRALNIFRYFH